jgi:hypothetical protein
MWQQQAEGGVFMPLVCSVDHIREAPSSVVDHPVLQLVVLPRGLGGR